MIGIKRLASHLNVSIGTVSRALNNRPDVNDATRQRVLAAAEELGYVPNQSGRSLRRGRTGVIGFMMQTGHEIADQGDSFFMSVFDGVQTVLGRHHLDLVALLCASGEDTDGYLRRMVSRGLADGFIISSTQRVDPRISFLAERQVPFATLGRSTTDAGQPWLDIDFETIARDAVLRLVDRGHRRIAVTVPHDETNLGYIFRDAAAAALASRGLALDPALVFRSTPSEAGGYGIARGLLALAERPTAILLVNETITTGFYRGLFEADYLPGRDIAVIGRYSPQTRYLSPTLTSYRLSLQDLGVSLGEALLASMPAYAEAYPVGRVRKVWPLEFIAGESDNYMLAAPGGR
ncbi:MAG TPA: LacI family DNA-binding transcriptional regulator [Devosia sp.]|nr:LacI family DNA-binding transcriptional regulator [Devosia sp.]